MATRLTLRSSALVLAATVVAALSGCATSLSSSAGSASTPFSLSAHQIGGQLHGGNQPVTGATLTLWAAGAPTSGGGYGTGATMVGTTTTDLNGNFTFTNSSTGNSPCTTGQYLYITAVGGNTGAGTNPYAAMMAALPTPCSPAATGGTFVTVNEVTTVAAVWSLQQFMTITPGATGGTQAWTIGAPSTNLVGLANAFAGSAQLVSINSGISAVSTVPSTLTTGAYTTTVTPDFARINTIADILAACVNTAGTSTCSSLFADTTPSSFTAPTDTIQAAYYLATNPGGLTMPAHSASNSPTYLCNTYVTGVGSPFIPALTCGTNTNDWLIGVSWKGLNPSAATVGTIYAGSVAIDGNGDIWTGPTNSSVTTNIVNEFSPTGAFLINPVSTANIPAYNVNFDAGGTTTALAEPGQTGYALAYGRNFAIAIDTNGNAWYPSYYGASPGSLVNGSVTVPTGVLAEITPGNQTGVATGFIVGSNPGPVAIDGNNNIYQVDEPTTGRFYISELTQSSNYTTLNEGVGRATAIYNSVFIDDTFNQYMWAMYSATCTPPATIVRANSTYEASSATTANITDSTGCAYAGAADALGNAWVSATGNLYYLNVGASATATVTTVTGSVNTSATGNGGFAGLDNPGGIAIDGAGNVWALNAVTSTLVGLSEISTTTNNGVTTYAALSPGGSSATQAGIFGFQTDGASGAEGVQIDPSGNIWLNLKSGSYLYHMVGAAAPTVTPVAQNVALGSIGTRP